MNDVVFRDLRGMTEFLAAEALQREVWGAGDKEDPADLMMVIQHEGGLAGGAFVGGELMGYIFGFPTREPHVQHSHRLGVRPAARGLGLGLRLKRFQRAWCLERGISLVRWTFDPLRHANASLNIARLGAQSSVYYRDFYGEMGGINAGVPSDRLLAEWRLDAPRAAALAADAPDASALPGEAPRTVSIPKDFETLLASDPQAARAERLRVRGELTRLFGEGFKILWYDAATARYLLWPV